MQLKPIETIIHPPAPHWVGNGFRVHTLFPSQFISLARMSPFLLLDYNAKIEFPPNGSPRGVDTHPHRGFETVSIAIHGEIAHQDSAGNSGIILPGDVQWMTAGAGILHKEYQSEDFIKRGGNFQMMQLWVNLPAKQKMTKPYYQNLSNHLLGKKKLANDSGMIEVIAGELDGVQGAATTFSPIHLYKIHLNPVSNFHFSLPSHYNTGILVYEGSGNINGTIVETDQFVLFENKGTDIQIETQSGGKFLLLSGEPIPEPIAAYGPFVMNTVQEIEQAFSDYRSGKFGEL